MNQNKLLWYLSGAPRISTRETSGTIGPRTHILGIINGFKDLGWNVDEYILGNHLGTGTSGQGSESKITKSYLRRLAADMGRLTFRYINNQKMHRILNGKPFMTYERMASFQSLGRYYQKQGIPWILETNAPLFIEATQDRKASALPSLLKTFEKKAYMDCDFLVTISDALKEILIKVFNLPEKKIIMIPNGVTIPEIQNGKHNDSTDDLCIGFCGKVSEWQKLDLLIETVSTLRNSGMGICVDIVGDGPHLPYLKSMMEAKGYQEWVKLHGLVAPNKVPKYLNLFDIGYSRPAESLSGKMYLSPLKIYEYLANGIPLLAGYYPDAVNLVEQSNAGFLFDPDNLENLKETIQIVYEKRDSLSKKGMKGRQCINDNHTWTHRVQKMLEIILPQLEKKYGKII